MNRPAIKLLPLSLSVIFVMTLLVISYQLTSAAPIASTPGEGIASGTINTGSGTQTKVGSLNVLGGLCLAGDCKTAWSQMGTSQWTTTSTGVFFLGGNVGIGTANPTSTLSVAGEIRNTAGGVRYPDTSLQTSAWNSASTMNAQQVTAGIFASNTYSFPSSVGIATGSTNGLPQSLSVYGGGYISGSLGIGTSAPGQKLTVAGAIESTSGGFKFSDATVQTTAAGAPSQWTTAGPNISFTGGNVGIGTANPTSTLSVAGEIKTTTGVRYPDAMLQTTAWNSTSTISAQNVTQGVFSPGFYAYPSSLGIATTSQMGLPQSLSVYGNGYVSGSLGIGTSTPGSMLTVVGTIESTSGGLKFPDGTIQLVSGIGAPNQWTTASPNIYFTGGNVGIGTVSPTAPLTVAGEIKTTTGGVRYPDATVQTTAWNNASTIAAGNITSGVFGSGPYSFQSSLGVGTTTTALPQTLSVYGNGYIAGNLGINITPPLEALHLAQSMGNGPRILIDNRSGAASKNASLAFAKNGVVNWLFGSDLVQSNGTDIFSIYGGATPSHRLTIDTNGFVGINTQPTTSTLTVQGTLRLSGSASGFVGLSAGATTSTVTYALPVADGLNNQLLAVTGTGAFAWRDGSGFWAINGTSIYYNNGFVGVGTSTVEQQLHVANGNFLVDAKGANPSTTFTLAWGQYQTPPPPGWQNAMVSYNGKLYLGSGSGVYRYDGGTTWTSVGQPGGAYVQAKLLMVYNGALYAATNESTPAIYRYNGGTAWTSIGALPATVGSVTALGVNNGKLYIGDVKNIGSTTVFCIANAYSWDGATWMRLTTDDYTLTYNLSTPKSNCGGLSSFAVYNGNLYGAVADGLVWRYDGGTSWTRVGGNSESLYYQVQSLTVYNGSLYMVADFCNGGCGGGGRMWVFRYDGGTTWTSIQGNMWGGPIFEGSRTLGVYNGQLYSAGDCGTTGCYTHLWRYEGGATWTSLDVKPGYQYVVNVMTPFSNSLFLSASSEIYYYTANTAQSYALKFKSEQEVASLNFRTGSSGQGNQGQAQHGQFIFSHGLLTNSGAYDVAESYATRDAGLEPGDVVSASDASSGSVRRSRGAYDSSAIGVVATKPGLVLSGDSSNGTADARVNIAMAGRAPVKVTLGNGAIKRGDPITSSSRSGYGMKATKSGKIIGFALEDFKGTRATDRGRIMVQISQGWFGGISEQASKTSHHHEPPS